MPKKYKKSSSKSKKPKEDIIDKNYKKITKWVLKSGNIDKELSPKNPNLKYVLALRFAPKSNIRKPLLCAFPNNEDFFIIESRLSIDPKSASILLKFEEKRKNFIVQFIKYSLDKNLHYRYHLGGKGPLFFQISIHIFYEELSKPLFYKEFNKLGNYASYLQILFTEIVLEKGIQEDSDKPKNSKNDMYS